MKILAKAALGALALASLSFAVPADAAVVSRTTTVTVEHNGCMNGCFHRGDFRRQMFVRRAIRHEMMREAFRHERRDEMRQAFLERRFQDRRFEDRR